MTRFSTTAACLCTLLFVSKQAICESTFYVESEESLVTQRARYIKAQPSSRSILGAEPEDQIHFGPHSSLGISKDIIALTDLSVFQDTGASSEEDKRIKANAILEFCSFPF